MQEINLTVSGNDAPIPLTVESGRIIHDGGLPAGGTTGQVLTKTSDADGDADWQTPSDGAVQSVNGQTGTVVLGAVDVGAGTYSKPAGGIPASDLAAGVIPEVPVQDVQVNGVSVLQDGVANVPIAQMPSGTSAGNFGLVALKSNRGIAQNVNDKSLYVAYPTARQLKNGNETFIPVTTAVQHDAAFYGLAKAAGSDEKNSTLPVGQYTDNAKDKIQQMLGIIDMIAPHEGAQAANAYSVGDAFCYSGKLYKATASIAIGDAIVPGTNCTQTTLIELIGGI